MASAPDFVKPPSAALDYSVDWGPEMERIGAGILSSYWVVPSAFLDSPGNPALLLSDSVTPDFGVNPQPRFSQGGTYVEGDIATVVVAGGTEDTDYILMNVIRTNETRPRVYSKQITISVRN